MEECSLLKPGMGEVRFDNPSTGMTQPKAAWVMHLLRTSYWLMWGMGDRVFNFPWPQSTLFRKTLTKVEGVAANACTDAGRLQPIRDSLGIRGGDLTCTLAQGLRSSGGRRPQGSVVPFLKPCVPNSTDHTGPCWAGHEKCTRLLDYLTYLE